MCGEAIRSEEDRLGLVYCSFAIQGQFDKVPQPLWVEDLEKSLTHLVAYNPFRMIEEHLANSRFRQTLEKNTPLAHKRFASCPNLQLPELILQPLEAVEKFLCAADATGVAEHIVYKDLYVLARADIFVTDICRPSFGGPAMEQMYAWAMDIGCVAVSNRWLNSPWTTHHSSGVVKPAHVDIYVRGLLRDYDEPEPEPDEDMRSSGR